MNRLVARAQGLKRENRRALAPFVTAGDGGLDVTLDVLRALDRPSVACVELGLPFSDPIADGPVLQAAADRALASGTTFEGVLALIARLRALGSELPIAVMSYANPLLVRGLDVSCASLARAGADAVLVPDLPVEEGDDLCRAADANDLSPIFFVAPTTSDARMQRAIAASRGFVYAIGRFGVTGSATDLGGDAQSFLERVRAKAGSLPVAVGFGIRDAESVRAAVRHADLAIVGSALVERIHAHGPPAARAFVTELERGLSS